MPAPFPRHLPQHKPTFPPRLIPVPSSDREAANLSKCDSTPPQCGPPIVFNERKRRLEEEEDSSTSQKACRHDTPSSRDRSDSDDWHELLSTLIPQHDFKSDDIWHGELLSADELREIQWTKEI